MPLFACLSTNFAAAVGCRELGQGCCHFVALNIAEGWSRDVSEVVAMELRVRCANQGRELPESLQQFVERYESAKA